MNNEPPAAPHDAYSALRLRDFRFYLTGNVLAGFGMQMQTVAVGWEIYERTGSKLALGLVGLVQFLPVICLVLLTGHVADTFNRKYIVMTSMVLFASASIGLAYISASRADYRWMYLCLFAAGVARAFQQPAKTSLLPQIVPMERFSNAVTWNTGGFHLASVAGPAVGGLLIGVLKGAAAVYILDAASALGFFLCLALLRIRLPPRAKRASTFDELVGGLSFLRRNQIIFGAITLDMFAVLLGGAVTLLPVYAEDILHVGPEGLGWLRTAPAIGALSMAMVLAHRPPVAKAGRAMLGAVAAFGVATIVFGLSRNFWLSLVMLFLTGAFDNISVVVRHTLVQLLTPDDLRGRVSAINGLFIGASNELGGFESGLVAALFSPTISVVSGGVGTLLALAVIALKCPRLRRYGRLGSAGDEA
jgi:MFS family permease